MLDYSENIEIYGQGYSQKAIGSEVIDPQRKSSGPFGFSQIFVCSFIIPITIDNIY